MALNFSQSIKPEQFFTNNTVLITRGNLVLFRYAYAKPGHDPSPLVLLTDVWPSHIRGVNVNYLTMPIIRDLISGYCGNKNFSYLNIKGNNYIKSAFRQYKRIGVSGLKTLNCDLLKGVLTKVRAAVISPTELEAIKNSVKEQISQVVAPKASEIAKNE